MIELTPQDYRVLVRHDLYAFVHRCFLHLHPSQQFMPNWHIEVIVDALERCRLGQCRRLISNEPPRQMKSLIASVAFPAWVLGHNPSRRILCVSHGQGLADKLARDCRSIITAPWYQALFPGTRLAAGRQAVAHFATTQQGCRIATSLGGGVTGFGADMIIIDDPIKAKDAMSAVKRADANERLGDSILTRLDDKQNGCIILLMQRLHEEDPAGFLLKQGGWELLALPAIAEEAQSFSFDNLLGRFEHRRAVGDVLHPERESLEQLEEVRRAIGEFNFSAQYQQNPAPACGGMVQVEWFRRYSDTELPPFERVILSVDSANKDNEWNDYSVCTVWGEVNKRYYLLDVWRKQVNYPDLKRAIRSLSTDNEADAVVIEDNGSGTQLIQDLQAEGLHTATPYKSKGDKRARFAAQTDLIANGFVCLPEQAPWLREYLHELSTFPNGRYKDQVDSTAQALDWLRHGHPAWNFMQAEQILQLNADKGNMPTPQLIRRLPFQNANEVEMIAPDNGVSHVYPACNGYPN